MAERTETSIRIEDTTPRARERNNLTIRAAPVGLIRKIATAAEAQGVDPDAALAAAWKESGMGTIVHPQAKKRGLGQGYPLQNPMQYNAVDIGEEEFNNRINQRLSQNADYRDAVIQHAEAEKLFAQDPETYKPELDFQRARIKAIEDPVIQDEYIRGGVNYLKKTIAKHPGNLEGGFAKYRGAGQAARYHGRHVMELYKAIKKNPDLQRIVKQGKDITSGYGLGGK